ncbi:DUF4350 domain-containing protein [Altererythrobacter sp. Root672]|uniref:DUF4350 domain-containing protein n=1 Tax=Altererythrobacter sp. Root672 TaxID=1736584 RepID=UPI0006F46402|nr:DUF4350 domain-containing protein [Altererythrobacter sp. Root672]KRA81257.1 hypothetical protein ASD76_11790 [Altererythrobacter sp. Root672]
MSRSASPFSPKMILAVLVVGAGAFLLFLYAIGAGWDGREDRNGGSHAAANGLNGFAGLTRLLKAQGYDVSLSRSKARLQDEVLLVITPDLFQADGEEISRIIRERRYAGPTLLILPKWTAGKADSIRTLNVPRGWVILGGAGEPEFVTEIDGLKNGELRLAKRERWYGLDLEGTFPVPDETLGLRGDGLMPLISDKDGEALAGYINDKGVYPYLADAAGIPPLDGSEPGVDDSLWPVVVVVEPDLMNNYGLADAKRAEAAVALVETTLEDYDLPIVFDLTVAGLGRNENLLTMAFRPPFLAATLCLILAALLIAWRSFRRFGPPVAEAPSFAMGKQQLARNSAALVERARRLHLLGPPYAALVSARIAAALNIREAEPGAREAAIARVQALRGLPADFPERAEALRNARRPADLLRAAGALRSIERTLVQ